MKEPQINEQIHPGGLRKEDGMAVITKTIARDLPNGDYIEVTVEERDGSTGLSPGFSITASVWERNGQIRGRARKRNGRDIDMGGAMHEEILRWFPQLQPIVHVHLADQEGVPMHAKANGWYFYSGGAAAYEREQVERGNLPGYYGKMLETPDHDRAARALSIPPADLPTGLDKEQFEAFVDSLSERYAADAQRARDVMASIRNGQGVEG